MANGINSPFGLSPYISNVGKADITKMMPYGIGYQKLTATGEINTLPYNIYSGDPVVFSGMYLNADNTTVKWVGLNAENSSPVNTAGTVVPLGNIPGTITDDGTIAKGKLNAPIVGVAISARYNNPNNIYNVEYPFWPANTQIDLNTPPLMYVNDDPEALFTVQCSTSTEDIADAIFTWDMIGQNVALAVGGAEAFDPLDGLTATPNPATGNNQTGQSAYYADLSTITNKNLENIDKTERFNFKILGIVPPINLNNVGNQNVVNAQLINNMVVGVNMPFVTIFGKINNHIYGAPTKGVQLA